MSFKIVTDSCCDLPAEIVADLDLVVVNLTVEMDGRIYREGEMTPKALYDHLRNGKMPKTSAVNPDGWASHIRPALEDGQDVLVMAFSSALSATYQSAVIAAEELKGEFPEAEIRVVDTLSASVGQGLLIYLCAQQQKAGKSLDEVCAYAEEMKHHMAHWVTVDDLNHLKRGGRVSAATAAFGTMLNIKPLIHINEEGKLISVGKARGRKAALLQVVAEMEKRLMDPALPVFISHGDCEEDAKFVADEVTKRTGAQVELINYVGPVIGAHTGAGVIALCFVGNER